MKNDNVSICVITYNSSLTVIDLLNSILKQTYGSENLELVISDDASTDTTLEKIEHWLKDYSHHFYHVILIPHKENNGISKNVNSAWKACTCDWIKTIAGDDLLTLNSIDLYQKERIQKPDVKIFFSFMYVFLDDKNNAKSNKNLIDKSFFEKSASDQHHLLANKNYLSAPSSYINRMTLSDVGYADECYMMMEDYPLWYKLTKNNIQLHLIKEHLVYYRTNGISHNSKSYLRNPELYMDNIRFINNITKHHTIDKNQKRKLKKYKQHILAENYRHNKFITPKFIYSLLKIF